MNTIGKGGPKKVLSYLGAIGWDFQGPTRKRGLEVIKSGIKKRFQINLYILGLGGIGKGGRGNTQGGGGKGAGIKVLGGPFLEGFQGNIFVGDTLA